MAKFVLMPKDTGFYDLFERDTANLVVATQALVDFFDEKDADREARATEFKAYEEQGDRITHEIMKRLHRTFVTPIDREDIAQLAHVTDTVMDFVEAAARTLVLYRMDEPTPHACQLARIVQAMAIKLNDVMPCLRDRKQFAHILRVCVEVNSLENDADDVHHAAQAELFNTCSNAVDVIKWRELYQHLEDATDMGEDVANILEGIVLKNA